MPELNAQIIALDETGSRLGLGLRGKKLRKQLVALNGELPEWSEAGSPPERFLESLATRVTPGYRRLVEEWLAGADLATLLEGHRVTAESADVGRSTLAHRLAYPLFVATLACIGLAFTCYSTLPVVESTYADLREPVGKGVEWLQRIRSLTPLWLVGVPLLLLLGVISLCWFRPLKVTRSRREVGAVARSRYAQSSQATASLMEAGIGPGEAARVALASSRSGAAVTVPPLLAWASSSDAADSQANVPASSEDFKAIGTLYRDFARRGFERFTTLTPLVAFVAVGGGATLLYGLALFLPLVELLWSLSF